MATIESLKRKHNNPSNVRKALNVIAFFAPMSVELPEALTQTGGELKELPAGYSSMGTFTTDGAAFSTDVSVEDVEALGYAGPVRSDIVKAPRTVKLNVFEMLRKKLLELVHGVDLSQTKADKDTGEIVFDDSALPMLREQRLLVISTDGPTESEWVMGWGFPKVKLASIPGTDLKSSDPIKGELEFKVLTDEKLNTPCRNYIGGSAAIRYLDAIGFEKAA